MSIPKPPFHTASEELLYNIYLKLQVMNSLQESDINTLAKLNAILTDADLMKADDVIQAINAIKGNVPDAGNTLEKLFNIIQGFTYLKAEDIDTLAELNAILTDADIINTEVLQSSVNAIKGNAPVAGDTLEKLYNLLQPILNAWVQDGNNVGSTRTIGTKDNFPLPFITGNVERGRFDLSGNFLIGFNGIANGKIHLRTNDTLETNYAAYIDDPTFNILFGLTNSGKVFLNKDRANVLVNGGWPGMTGIRNLIFTSGAFGARLVDSGNDNSIVGYNAASSSGVSPARSIARNVVIGSEAGSSDNNGSSYTDCVYVGYRAGYQINLNTGQRNTMIGASAGATASQGGTDHTLVGYDAQNARSNSYNTLLGSGTRAYNSLGDLISNGGGQSYMTAIGAGAIVRTANTIVIGRVLSDQIVVGAESCNYQLPGVTANLGFNGYKFQIVKPGSAALGVSGSSFFRDGSFSVNLGEEGSSTARNSFRINSYISGYGAYEFLLSSNNANATLEITDYQFGGTKTEMLRLTPAGYANTAILVRPNDLYHTGYGFRYILQGVNTGLQSRFISAFHGQINLSVDDNFASYNRAQIFTAQATVTNHYIDGFYADVRGTDVNAQVFAFRSLGSRINFDGTGMTFTVPVTTITTDGSAHAGATALLSNGSFVTSAALFIIPKGSERTGLIISPGQAQSNGLFISPQQALGTFNYDGYLMWLQYSTTGNNMLAGTSKPMLFIRKHNAVLNGFDHTGAFIRLEENIGSTGPFLEAFKYDTVSNSLKLKFSVNKDGVVSIGQVTIDPASIAGVGRLYFVGEDLKFVTPSGVVRTVKF
ncbi:MAG TPA: hypothetical protein PKL56_16000 [Cyclobacteriaceae bacterium]|nr:hypothetical protein [Cyclobacteriaceae bacterium]HMX88040.1 hypothetical protein [Saprospiraceae bacterium]HMX00872.1 hypothetical protein [Cyclobacteriaceae bacterium]HMY93676.1 hypothetical protein [Cyclobacteriaceae bacterium]HNA12890.1 hypothetical protein [Cyclobacteriaceae bacterium]